MKKDKDLKEFENFNLNDFIEIRPDGSSFESEESEQNEGVPQEDENSMSTETQAIKDISLTKPIKRNVSSKQRKASLQEYKETYLGVPKIMDRKTVFISNELRERVVEIVLRLGYEKSSVSGFVENLVKVHLSDYEDDINTWKKL